MKVSGNHKTVGILFFVTTISACGGPKLHKDQVMVDSNTTQSVASTPTTDGTLNPPSTSTAGTSEAQNSTPPNSAVSKGYTGPTAIIHKNGGLIGFAIASTAGSFSRLESPSGAYNLVMQSDGNLVENNYITKVWSSGTSGAGTGPYQAVLQSNGTLAVLGASGTAIWSSGTGGKGTPPYELTVQNDGNVVIFDATSTALWSTNQTSSSQDLTALPFGAAVASSGSFTTLSSPNGAYTLTMQAGGNLVLAQGSTTLWSSKTSGVGTAPYQAAMLASGDLAVTDASGTVTFKSGSAGQGKPPYTLVLNNYGNVKIYDTNQLLVWSMIGTAGTVLVGSSWSPPASSLIANKPANRCLSTPKNGSQTFLWDCSNADVNQVMIYSFDQELQIGADATRCLTYETPANAQAYVDTQPCSGATLQRWSISAADGSFGAIHPLIDVSQCLDVASAGTANNSAVIVATCTAAASQNWSKSPTGYGSYNTNLSYWPDPSYTDPATIAKQEMAWTQVSAKLVAAAKSGAPSFTIPPGIYRAANETDINNVNNFTIYAAGVEIIGEPGINDIFGFYNDTSITINGPIIFDVDPQLSAWVPATVIATDGQNWAQIQEWPGYPPLEQTLGQQSWFRLQFYDQMGTRIPQGIEYPINPVGSSGGFTAQGGGKYTFPIYASQIQDKTLGIGTYVNVNVYSKSVIGAQNLGSLTLKHGRVYGGVCCQFYAPNQMVYRDWKLMHRPGTNRLSGPQALTNIGTGLEGTWILDEGEVGPATDDLIDVHTGPITADSAAPQAGLSANQFYLPSTWGIAAGWVFKFLDPNTNAVAATATVTSVASTTHLNADGGSEQLITLDQNVSVVPGMYLDSVNYKMALGEVVDSYFHDGDNQGIQLKGSHTAKVTNNYITRVDSSSVYVAKDYESDFNDYVTINNNTMDQSTYCPGNCLPWQAILATTNSLNKSIAQYGISSVTVNNNLITRSQFGISLQSTAQIIQNNNQFTSNPSGALQGWIQQ